MKSSALIIDTVPVATFAVPARLFGAAERPVVQVVDPAAARA
jgi:hypothetical protein